MFWSFSLNESVSVARFMGINLGIIELYIFFFNKNYLSVSSEANANVYYFLEFAFATLMALEGCQ